MFNLTFDDYFLKRVDIVFPQNPIFSNYQERSDQMLSFEIDFDLIFGIPYRALNVELNVEDNQVSKASKNVGDSTIT